MVAVSHPIFGRMQLVARNLSSGGVFLETAEPLPLGCTVLVHFGADGHEVVARAEVRNHFFLNFADKAGPSALTGMGLRFLGFEIGSAQVDNTLH